MQPGQLPESPVRSQQIPKPIQESILRVAHIAGHLFHPGRVRPGGDSSDTDLPGGHPHKRQHIIGHQPCHGPHLHRKEVHRRQHFQV
jgi:hypothetical protein